MSMRILELATRLRPDDAHTLLEFLDQLRDVLLQHYGDDIAHLLQHDCVPLASESIIDDDVPF